MIRWPLVPQTFEQFVFAVQRHTAERAAAEQRGEALTFAEEADAWLGAVRRARLRAHAQWLLGNVEQTISSAWSSVTSAELDRLRAELDQLEENA